MWLKRIHFAAVTALCFLGPSTLALAQTSGPGSTSPAPGAASPAGTPSAVGSVPGGVGPAPEPTPGQSIAIPPNTQATPQGTGPAPAPTPGQSTVKGPRPHTRVDSVAEPLPKSRQSRMRNVRKPRKAATVGSGSLRPESPSRPECFVTPSISKEPGQGGKQPPIEMPQSSPTTGRPAATKPRC